MFCISPSWFDTQEPVLRMRIFQNETNYWQISWYCSVIMNLVSSNHFTNSTVALMICLSVFVRLSYPYWLWRRIIPYTWFLLRDHSGCNRPAKDAYSFAAHDPIFGVSRGLCKPDFSFRLFNVPEFCTDFDCRFCYVSGWTNWFWLQIVLFYLIVTHWIWRHTDIWNAAHGGCDR
jgi:hypothetical protein